MVEKAITAAHFFAKGCTAVNAFVVIVCFTALGLLAGFFIGSYFSPLQ